MEFSDEECSELEAYFDNSELEDDDSKKISKKRKPDKNDHRIPSKNC